MMQNGHQVKVFLMHDQAAALMYACHQMQGEDEEPTYMSLTETVEAVLNAEAVDPRALDAIAELVKALHPRRRRAGEEAKSDPEDTPSDHAA